MDCDEGGMSDHECGDDTCCCADPQPNVVCETCDGKAGWILCLHEGGVCEMRPQGTSE